jgi:hypothetical protein
MEPIAVGGAWTPDPEVPYEEVRLGATTRDVWAQRVVAPVVSIEPGQGCRVGETHPGTPCRYSLTAAKGGVDGRCLTAAALRAGEAVA